MSTAAPAIGKPRRTRAGAALEGEEPILDAVAARQRHPAACHLIRRERAGREIDRARGARRRAFEIHAAGQIARAHGRRPTRRGIGETAWRGRVVQDEWISAGASDRKKKKKKEKNT